MATELDHDAIKESIRTILRANATLFDVDNLAKIRAIEVGYPEGNAFDPQEMDHIFITNGNPFETIRNRGVVQSNAIKDLEHSFNYDIVIMVNGKDARETEEKLDDFQKLVLQLIEADVTLTGTGSALVHNAFPVSAQAFQGRTGVPVMGRVLTIRCTMHTK